MGTFTDPNIVKEFSYRTKINYYTMLKDYSQKPSDRERAIAQIKSIKEEMIENGYLVSGYYEVTQLINSLIGFLVFPEQMYFDCLPNNPSSLRTDFPVLESLVRKDSFSCTYKSYYGNRIFEECPTEKKSPVKVIKHLRNSVSHKHLMIRPLNSRFDNSDIESIVFEDACLYEWNGNRWVQCFNDEDFQQFGGYTFLHYRPKDGKKIAVFHLEVPVKELEPLLLEICDYFVRSN